MSIKYYKLRILFGQKKNNILLLQLCLATMMLRWNVLLWFVAFSFVWGDICYYLLLHLIDAFQNGHLVALNKSQKIMIHLIWNAKFVAIEMVVSIINQLDWIIPHSSCLIPLNKSYVQVSFDVNLTCLLTRIKIMLNLCFRKIVLSNN